MQNWKILGTIATLIIVLSLPFYAFKQKKKRNSTESEPAVTFVTSESCSKCHKQEYKEWQNSHHAKAMAVASNETVLGDFNDSVFMKNGVESRFYRKSDGFFVYTRGPKGEMAEYEISHTFGWYPLQQYLIPFPGGKMQCLPIAWNDKEKKWFHLYPDLTIDPEEWIYWANQGQNWNSMCADCHSTELQKNYNPGTGNYNTKWAEISVGCEACHGPGSKHLAWGELPQMARSKIDNGLVVQTSRINNRQQVELCAPCHSRRSMLGDYSHKQQDLLNTEISRLLEEGLYYPDGQIRDEVYVYASFVQSKMYANDVRCSDCHNVHSIKLHQSGNELCLQCHQAAIYDSKEHHFHKQTGETGDPIKTPEGEILFNVGSGAECVGCHMPGRTYMGNDYRPDHSIRIPRPDLSEELATPNACNRCHNDKTNTWSAEYTRKWYGSKQKFHFGTIFKNGRNRNPQALDHLLLITSDKLTAVLVRATALSLLGRYQETEDVTKAFQQALNSDESLLRRTAASYFPAYLHEQQIKMLVPLLNDPVKAVRIEAARALTNVPPSQLSSKLRKQFDKAVEEFEKTALYSSDFAASRLNLGALYSRKGDFKTAEKHLKKAIDIDRDFYAARTNLAVLYSRQGKNALAEQQLRRALETDPDLANVHYSLGLLLVEQKQYNEAVEHLQKAASMMLYNSRVHYNLGQLLDFLHQYKAAEKALVKTIELEPHNMNYLQTVANFYVKRRELAQAKSIAEQIIMLDPANPFGQQLLKFINENSSNKH